jgi:hypothetical protein
LKLLHGSKLREQSESFGIVYDEEPPYEIKSSPWLDTGDMLCLKQADNALGHTYNKGRFLSALEYVLSLSGYDPLSFYRSLGEAVPGHGMPLSTYAERFLDFCAGLPNVSGNRLRDCMIRDWLGMVKGKNMPPSLKIHGERRKDAVRTAEKALGRAIDRDEAAVLSTGEIVFADAHDRDPVTGIYRVI